MSTQDMEIQHSFNNAITTLSKLIQSSNTFADRILNEPETVTSKQIDLFKKVVVSMNDEIQVLRIVYKDFYHENEEQK